MILVGDLNTVQSELDYNKEGREHFTGRNRGREGERLSAMAASLGIVDSFRFKHPVLKQLSYTCSKCVHSTSYPFGCCEIDNRCELSAS